MMSNMTATSMICLNNGFSAISGMGLLCVIRGVVDRYAGMGLLRIVRGVGWLGIVCLGFQVCLAFAIIRIVQAM